MTAQTLPATRPFYWSMRREVWENRFLYVALLAAAGVGGFAFLFSLVHLPQALRENDGPVALIMPYSHLAMLVELTAFLVGIFYSLEALHSERSERSILFWKSLPVSDRTTVLAKASIPLLLLPALAFVITVAAQLVMLLLSLVVVLGSGQSVAAFWTQLPLFEMQLVLLYELAVLVLWHAPIYGWLLLVSGWARRAVFLWAFLPPLALGLFEFFAFHTTHVFGVLGERLFGFAADAFTLRTPGGQSIDPHLVLLEQLTPGRYFRSPGLWIGLVTAAVLITAAIRLRRYREPV
jgi:ABC-2 type transport system permease protein